MSMWLDTQTKQYRPDGSVKHTKSNATNLRYSQTGCRDQTGTRRTLHWWPSGLVGLQVFNKDFKNLPKITNKSASTPPKKKKKKKRKCLWQCYLTQNDKPFFLIGVSVLTQLLFLPQVKCGHLSEVLYVNTCQQTNEFTDSKWNMS